MARAFSDVQAFVDSHNSGRSGGGSKGGGKFLEVGKWYPAKIEEIVETGPNRFDSTFTDHTVTLSVGEHNKMAFFRRPTKKLLYGDRGSIMPAFELMEFISAVTGEKVTQDNAHEIFPKAMKGSIVGKTVNIKLGYTKPHLLKEGKEIFVVDRDGKKIDGKGFANWDDAKSGAIALNVKIQAYPNIVDYQAVEGSAEAAESDDLPF